MADSNHAYDLSEAIDIGRVLDEERYAWAAELSPDYNERTRITGWRAWIGMAANVASKVVPVLAIFFFRFVSSILIVSRYFFMLTFLRESSDTDPRISDMVWVLILSSPLIKCISSSIEPWFEAENTVLIPRSK